MKKELLLFDDYVNGDYLFINELVSLEFCKSRRGQFTESIKGLPDMPKIQFSFSEGI
jgi:hypothetical protein